MYFLTSSTSGFVDWLTVESYVKTMKNKMNAEDYSPYSVVVRLGESNVMDNLILLGMSRAQIARENGSRAALMKMTTGSQSLVVRANCIVKGRGRSGAGGRKGATYKKRTYN